MSRISLFWVLLGVYLSVFLIMDADFFSTILTSLNYKPNAFHGQVVWITGASSGIGAQLAKDLANEGAQVILSARRQAELDMVADDCIGLKPFVLPLDVLDFEAQSTAYKIIIQKFGHIDILILNAGRSQRALYEDFPIDKTKEIFDLNVMSVINLAQIVLPSMVTSNSGQVVVMSSLAGKIGGPIQSTYSSSKYALHGYFDALRTKISQFNISVLLVCPGPVESSIAENAIKGMKNVNSISEGKKMPTSRCTSLVLRAMYNRDYIQEIWIGMQPLLTVAYLNVYFPWISRQLMTKVIGPSRRKALISGGNVYDIKTMLGFKKE